MRYGLEGNIDGKLMHLADVGISLPHTHRHARLIYLVSDIGDVNGVLQLGRNTPIRYPIGVFQSNCNTDRNTPLTSPKSIGLDLVISFHQNHISIL